jgi:hypothetical protein
VLRTQQGRGSFVRQSTIEYTLGLRTRFSQNLAKHNVSGRLRVLESGVVAASAEVAKALGLRTGTAVERVEAELTPLARQTRAVVGQIGDLSAGAQRAADAAGELLLPPVLFANRAVRVVQAGVGTFVKALWSGRERPRGVERAS